MWFGQVITRKYIVSYMRQGKRGTCEVEVPSIAKGYWYTEAAERAKKQGGDDIIVTSVNPKSNESS